MEPEIRVFDSKEISGLRVLLRSLVASYTVGWVILGVLADPLPNLEIQWPVFKTLAWVMVGLSVLLAIRLTIKTLYVWATVGGITAIIRGSSFLLEGTWNAFGVWMLVLSGITITSLAVVSVNAVTGHMDQKYARDE